MVEGPVDRRALYLRWRPPTLADVVGQEHVVRTLRNAVIAGTPAHAYLFAGPRGTGKTSVARILFRAVNCEAPRDGDPCGECQVCLTALAGRSLDLVEIDAASNRGIDDIRELRDKVAFAPSEVRYRVYIVDEAHELTAAAWDAFLKTLEEPPPHAIFVLATTEAHRVPGTIVSRCQRFDFRRIKPAAIAQRLREIADEERLELAPAAADRLARMARGGLRDAISLLDQAASFTAGKVDLDALREVLGLADGRSVQAVLEAVGRGDPATTLEQVAELADGGADLRLFAEELVGQLRGLLFAQAGAARALAGEFSAEDLDWLGAQAGVWQPARLRSLLCAIGDAVTRVRDSAQFSLQLELALLEACGRDAPERSRGGESGTVEVSLPSRPSASPDRERPAVAAGPAVAVPPPEPSAAEHAGGPLVSEPPPAWPELDAPLQGREVASAVAALDVAAALADPPPVGGLSLEQARRRWSGVIEWLDDRNPFVASYLRPAELASLDEGLLVLTFGYKVHFERVSEDRNRRLVEEGCERVLGQMVRLRCEYRQPGRTVAGDLDADDPVLRFALERFGGRAEPLDG